MITHLLSVASSFALDGEIAVETGALPVHGREFEAVTGSGALGTGGARFAVEASDHVSVVAGWRYGSRGSYVTINESDRFTAAIRGQELTLGAQLDIDPTEVVSPYLLVEGLALSGTMLFDSDLDRNDNPSQDKRSAFTGGGAALLGCDVHAKQGGAAFAPAAFLEMGYAHAAPLVFADYGKVPVNGFVVRLGAGVRF